MADNAVIGALRVVLGADTAAFEDGLKKATGSANSFASSITKIASGIGLEHGIEKAVESIVHAFKEAIKHADEMGKTAQKVGLPVEELSKLKLAADLSDVSMESLSKGLGKLSQAMVSASQGSGEAAATFKTLGISATDSDGKLRSAGDVLADVAGKFEGVKDGAAKTAIAMALFGRTGKDLIPLLNDGKHGLEEMMQAAKNMGLEISKNTAAQAQKLNDNIKLLDAAKQGLVNTVMAGLLPAFVRLSEQWVDTAKKGEVMRATADSIVDGVKAMTVTVLQAVEVYKLLAAIGKVAQDFNPIFPNIKQGVKDLGALGDAAANFSERFRAIRPEVEKMFTPLSVGAKKAGDEIDPVIGKIALAIEDLKFKTRIARHEFDNLSVGLPEALRAAGVPIAQIGTSVDSLKGKALELNTELAKAQAAKFNEEALTSWQLYENQLNRINQAYATGTMSIEAYQAATLKASTNVATAWGMTAQAIVSPMADAFKTLATMNKQYAGIAKVAAIGEALVNTYLAATKALASVPPPFNFAAAAAVTAAGLVNVAKIMATNFAHGGSFRVGGSGGMDSQPVGFMATPGEMIDIRTPGQERSDGGNVVNLTVHGESVSKDQMREMFETINSGIRDGYRINLAA